MVAESVQILQDRVRFCEDGVREIQRLTEEIDKRKASLTPLKAKISELAVISRGIKVFNESANEELSKLKKRKQKLENNSFKPNDKAKNVSNIESTVFEIIQYEKYIADYQAEIGRKG